MLLLRYSLAACVGLLLAVCGSTSASRALNQVKTNAGNSNSGNGIGIQDTSAEGVKTNGVGSAASNKDFVDGQALVLFAPFASEDAKGRALGRHNFRKLESVTSDATGELVLVDTAGVPPGLAKKVLKDQDVEMVVVNTQPNYIYRTQIVSNDPQYTSSNMWGMYSESSVPANPFGSRAAAAWNADKTDCSSVYVGIIDVGSYYMHPDLTNNYGNPNEIWGNGKDDDGNGYVDDTYGWDFKSNDNTLYHNCDSDFHGTHVAGTIGAQGGNSAGVVGVCWKVRILHARFMDGSGGATSNAVKAIKYFVDLKLKTGLKIVALSNSWSGCAGCEDLSLTAAIQTAADADILFVAAAANNGQSNDNPAYAAYPASTKKWNVISVAATDSTGNLASYSNYGPTSVHIAAPGSAITSTYPFPPPNVKRYSSRCAKSGYNSISGTSMATPHVSGAIALYKAYHQGAAALDIKNALLDNVAGGVRPLSSLNGKVVGSNFLDVGKLLGAPIIAPP